VSVFWETDHFGYDGDFLHGHIKVNYWQDPTKVEAEIDRQLAESQLRVWFCPGCWQTRDFNDMPGYELGRHFVGEIVPEDGSDPMTCDGEFVEVVPRSEAEALAEALESVVNVGDRAAVLTAEPALLAFRSRHPKEAL
jgi:hypothetical protein